MKHKWNKVKENKGVIAVEICDYCGVLVMHLEENDTRYLVEEPYHPVGGGEPCPETCEETETKITVDAVMKT